MEFCDDCGLDSNDPAVAEYDGDKGDGQHWSRKLQEGPCAERIRLLDVDDNARGADVEKIAGQGAHGIQQCHLQARLV